MFISQEEKRKHKNELHKEWVKKNPDKVREYRKKYLSKISAKDLKKYMREYRQKNKDHIRELNRKYQSTDEAKKKLKEYRSTKEYKESRINYYKNPDIIKKVREEWYQNYKKTGARKRLRDELNDAYVATVISNRSSLKTKDIPKDLIDAVRNLIKLNRFLRNQRSIK